MANPSGNQTAAIANMEASESQLREKIAALRSERRAESLARREAKVEAARQHRLERMAARLERGQAHVAATSRTVAPAKPSASKKAKTKDMWSNALKRAQGGEAEAPQPAKRDGIDRRELWRKAIKG